MSLRKTLFLFFLTGSTVCLAAAYGMIGSWWGAGLVILPGLFPLTRRPVAGRWLPPAYLSCMLGAAAIGIVAGATPHLMLLGAILALAAWDRMNLDRAMAGSGRAHSDARFEMKHARSLALALGLGLLAAEGGLTVSLPLPFPVMLLLAILLVFSVSRVFRLLAREKRLRER